MSSSQPWDPILSARNARFVSDLGSPVLELLAPQPGERILDLGCGDGALTKKLVDLECDVVAVDSSAPQVEAARKLGLDAHVMNAEALPFREEFDAVFSNAVLHWIKRADEMIVAVYRSLRPGGRFVAECGGHGCVDKVRVALVEALDRRGIDGEARVPWYFPTPEDYATRLKRAGFRVDSIALSFRVRHRCPATSSTGSKRLHRAFFRTFPTTRVRNIYRRSAMYSNHSCVTAPELVVADYVLHFALPRPRSDLRSAEESDGPALLSRGGRAGPLREKAYTNEGLLNPHKQPVRTVSSSNIDVGSGTVDREPGMVPVVSPATFPVVNLPAPAGTPMSEAKYSPLLFVKSLGVSPPAFVISNCS